MPNANKIGRIRDNDLKKVGISSGDIDVYFGHSNQLHMQNRHPADYAMYQSEISNIVNDADYIGYDQNDGSIELVKYFQSTGNYVKIAVRSSSNGIYYARSLYTLNPNRTQSFIANGTLQLVDKQTA